jgi:hypothetical protein
MLDKTCLTNVYNSLSVEYRDVKGETNCFEPRTETLRSASTKFNLILFKAAVRLETEARLLSSNLNKGSKRFLVEKKFIKNREEKRFRKKDSCKERVVPTLKCNIKRLRKTIIL